MPGDCPVASIKLVHKRLSKIAEHFIANEKVDVVISHDKFADALEAKYIKEFDMNSILEDSKDEAIVVKNNAEKDCFTQDDVNIEEKPEHHYKEAVVTKQQESFAIFDETHLHIKLNGKEKYSIQISDIQALLKLDEISKQDRENCKLVDENQFVMFGSVFKSAKELIHSHMAMNTKMVSANMHGDSLFVVLSNQVVVKISAHKGDFKIIDSGARLYLYAIQGAIGIQELLVRGETV